MLRLILLLLVAFPALAVAEDAADAADDEGKDSPALYEETKRTLAREAPTEEIDAWWEYLDTYPDTPYRLEIEARIEALEDAAYERFVEDTQQEAEQKKRIDAKDADLPIVSNPMMDWNPNTRRHLEVGAAWGATDHVQYDLQFEWAFLRRVSAFGGLRHLGPGGVGLGAAVYAGGKAALVKDARTNTVLSGALALEAGINGLEGAKFSLHPWMGFGWAPSDRFQLQTSVSMLARLDKLRTQVFWHVMAVISPIQPLGIFVASRQKHSLFKPSGLKLQYLAFYDAGVGVFIRPVSSLDIAIGATVPYFWRAWRDYRYIGITADVTFRFGKPPKG